MITKKYTHLFFDLDNTLWDFSSNSYEALYATLKRLNLLAVIGPYDLFFAIYSEENERLWDLYRKRQVTKKVLRAERFEAAFIRNGTPLTIGGGEVNDIYLEEMVNQAQLIEGARELLDYLHGRYKIAIITNGFTEVQYDKIHKSKLTKYFDKVITSEEIGTPKPGRKIFEYAAKSINAPKKSTLMIGDSWEADILGAREFGIDQVFFNPQMDKSDFGGLFLSIEQPVQNNIIKGIPSILIPDSENNYKNKVQTSLISRLDQLLVIL